MVIGLADVEFASQDRLDALGLGRVEKVDCSVDVAVVGHGNGLLSQGRNAIDELVDVAGAVEKGVFGVEMEVSEFSHGLTSF